MGKNLKPKFWPQNSIYYSTFAAATNTKFRKKLIAYKNKKQKQRQRRKDKEKQKKDEAKRSRAILYYSKISLFRNESPDEQYKTICEELLKTTCTTGDLLLMESAFKQRIFSTGSHEIDNLFSQGGISNGEIVEIVGQPQAGKTRIVQNFLIENLRNETEATAYYMDAKCDLQHNFYTMMQYKGINEEDMVCIMERICVKFIRSLKSLIIVLQNMTKIELPASLRFVIIDSITVPFHNNSGNYSLNEKLVTEVHSLIYQLAKELNLTFLITNLGLYESKEEEYCQDSEEVDIEEEGPVTQICSTSDLKPTLGLHWSDIIDQRLLITLSLKTDSNEENTIKRKLTLLDSRDSKIMESVELVITDDGIRCLS